MFLAVCKSTFFFTRFSLSNSRCISDVTTSTKLKQTGEIFWDSRCFLSAWILAFWARRMKVKWGVTLFYLLIVKYLSHWYCLNSATVYQIQRPYRGFSGGLFETFLEGYVNLIIYRNYIANRRSFIYCSLAWRASILPSNGCSRGDKCTRVWPYLRTSNSQFFF